MSKCFMALYNEPKIHLSHITPSCFFTICCFLVVRYFSLAWPLEVSAVECCRNHLWSPSSQFKPLRFWSSNQRAGPPPLTNPLLNHCKYLPNKTPDEKPFIKKETIFKASVLFGLLPWIMARWEVVTSDPWCVLKASVVKPVLNLQCWLGMEIKFWENTHLLMNTKT